MIKILATLILGMGLVIAQPANPAGPCENTDCARMHANQPKINSPSCPTAPDCDPMMERPDFSRMDDNPMMYDDMMCRQDPKQMVETIRVWKITEALNLTESQSMKFFPKWKEMRDAKEEFNQTRMKMVERLDGYMKDPKKFSSDIKSLVSELEASESRLHEKEARIKKEIANILTPEQQAKFLLFTMRFNREMREMVGKAREMGRGRQDMRYEHKQQQTEKRKLWKFW